MVCNCFCYIIAVSSKHVQHWCHFYLCFKLPHVNHIVNGLGQVLAFGHLAGAGALKKLVTRLLQVGFELTQQGFPAHTITLIMTYKVRCTCMEWKPLMEAAATS